LQELLETRVKPAMRQLANWTAGTGDQPA
jgi:hypothetical protein